MTVITACSRCSKPLSDPESMRLGLGPICRSKMKGYGVKEIPGKTRGDNERQERLFTQRPLSRFTYEILGDLIVIWDLYDSENPTMTVTNNITSVLEWIRDEESLNLPQYRVLYFDSYQEATLYDYKKRSFGATPPECRKKSQNEIISYIRKR